MWTSYLHIKKNGLLSMFQDEGRHSFQAYGIPTSGCMDQYSARLANMLVDNDPGHSILEMNFIGAEIEIAGDIYIAITGADMQATINGVMAPMYETIYVKDKSTLQFKNAVNGTRTYLAVAGNIETGEWLGSSSSYVSINISALQKNRLIPGMKVKIENTKMVKRKICPEEYKKSNGGNDKLIRLVRGPEYHWFHQDQIDFISSQSFTIDQKSNRMATNVKETLPDYLRRQELISSGILGGTIQISNDGSPIILMREAGTTGGYPRVAKVIDCDMNRLAQLAPGQQFNFEFISYQEARAVLHQKEKDWQRLKNILSIKN